MYALWGWHDWGKVDAIAEKTSMKIYLISLERDKQRRDLLKDRFPAHWDKFTWVKAIDASEAKSQIIVNGYKNNCPENTRLPLSLGEKCCAISHLQCLQQFLKSDAPYCIIIEDDIEGCDTDFTEALNITKKLRNEPAIVVLGGQQGMKNAKYLSGQLHSDNFWKVPKISMPFLTRACCYALNRAAAEKLVKSQKSCLRRSDIWEYYFKLEIRFFYSDIFKHPIDLKNSRLETERKTIGVVQKIINDGISNMASRSFKKILIFIGFTSRQLSKVSIK